jgi:hypothetical protein
MYDSLKRFDSSAKDMIPLALPLNVRKESIQESRVPRLVPPLLVTRRWRPGRGMDVNDTALMQEGRGNFRLSGETETPQFSFNKKLGHCSNQYYHIGKIKMQQTVCKSQKEDLFTKAVITASLITASVITACPIDSYCRVTRVITQPDSILFYCLRTTLCLYAFFFNACIL